MKLNGVHYRSIQLGDDGREVQIIDGTQLPSDFVLLDPTTMVQAAQAISDIWVCGAPPIALRAN